VKLTAAKMLLITIITDFLIVFITSSFTFNYYFIF